MDPSGKGAVDCGQLRKQDLGFLEISVGGLRLHSPPGATFSKRSGFGVIDHV